MAPRESLSLSISLSRRIAISWDIPRYLMLFMFYPSECIPAISKFYPKYAPLGKTTRPQTTIPKQWQRAMEKIEACVFQYHPPCRHTWAAVAPAISATFGLLSSRSKSPQPSPATKPAPPREQTSTAHFPFLILFHWLIEKEIAEEY